ETDTADENYEQVEILELTDDDEKLTELNAIEQRSFRSNKMDSNKQSASKPLVRQRLENNLTNYKSRSNENNQTNSKNDQGQQNSRPQRDMSNFFCFNCGEKGHGAQPTVISPQTTVSEGEKEEKEKVDQGKSKENSKNNLKIDEVKDLETSKEKVDQILQINDSLVDNCLSLNIEVDEDLEEEFSSDELVSNQQLKQVEISESTIKLSILNSADCNIVEINSLKKFNDETLKNWRPPGVSGHVFHYLLERKNYCPGTGLGEPNKAVKIPVEILIFGRKLRGIIDSGSERSFLSQSAYDRVKEFQLKELSVDSSAKNGVSLGDQSVVKTLGGTCFIIDIGNVYGPQWFSILPGLSGELILGMDFWLAFKVKVDPYTQTWTLWDDSQLFSFSHRKIIPTICKVLSIDQTEKLQRFLDIEFLKFEKESTGVTNLIEHVIELDDPIPHRQKPYRRSEAIRNF
ncbi:hypothetical protein PV326_001390, partial [Microctonus aethiopoides]